MVSPHRIELCIGCLWNIREFPAQETWNGRCPLPRGFTLRRWRTDSHSIITENLHSHIHSRPLLLLDTSPVWMGERSKYYQVILTFIFPIRKSLLLYEYLFRGTDFLRVCRKAASRNSTGLVDQGDKLQPNLIKDWCSFTLIKYSAL